MKDDMQGEVDQNNMTICFAKDIFSMLGMSLKLKTQLRQHDYVLPRHFCSSVCFPFTKRMHALDS